MKGKFLNSIAKCNIHGFGIEDYYSKAENISDLLTSYGEDESGIIPVNVKGELAGFVLWYIENDTINICRRAVYKKYRGLGLGIKLTKDTIKTGKLLGVPFATYAANWNLASINSSIKCGCFITKIGNDFTSLSTKKRDKNKC